MLDSLIDTAKFFFTFFVGTSSPGSDFTDGQVLAFAIYCDMESLTSHVYKSKDEDGNTDSNIKIVIGTRQANIYANSNPNIATPRSHYQS